MERYVYWVTWYGWKCIQWKWNEVEWSDMNLMCNKGLFNLSFIIWYIHIHIVAKLQGMVVLEKFSSSECRTFPSLACIFMFHLAWMLTPTNGFPKAVRHSTMVPLFERTEKNTLHMHRYYMMSVIAIPNHGYIITIVSKEEKTNLVSISNNLQRTCLDFAKISSKAVGKRSLWVSWKYLYYV